MNFKQFFCLIFLISISSFAQKSLSGFPTLTAQQLELKSVSFEKDAQAVILDETGYMNVFRGGYQLTVKRRIKILDEKAFDYGNIELSYYAKNNTEKITRISAQTINNNSGEYVNSVVDSKDIFDVKNGDDYNVVRFAFPNVKVGSILEYQYTLSSQNIYSAEPWYFQHDFPTLYSKYETKVELYGLHTKLLLGKRLQSKYSNIDKKAYLFELTNIPSVKELKYVYNANKVSESIRLQFTKYDTYPEFRKDFEKYNLLNESEFAVKNYAKKIPDGATEMETLKNTFNQFKKDFRWNNYRGIISVNAQRVTLNSKEGNLADLNILLNDILKQKGFKTNLILLTSRIHGKVLPSIPYVDHFDYLVNYIELKNGESFVINAVDIPENDFRFANLNLYNDKAYLLDESKNGKFVVINQILSENFVDFKYNFRNGTISESRKDVFNGFFYDKNEKDSKKLVSRYLEDPIQVQNDEKSSPINFVNNRYVVGHNAKIPFSAANTFYVIENPLEKFISSYVFDETDRKVPVEFNFPYYFKVNIHVEVPDGFDIIKSDNFDQTINPNSDLVYSQRQKLTGNNLIISYELYLGKAVFQTSDYEVLKQFFESVQQEAAKQISLKKK
ncbi:DUF3857 domain-containing protein [Faecalibacter macacae]|uniref:DUF3857 domain-containing protein n=1 Tax=Faecalibacter macacae TaxID=1859289 RepID=A0A3L9MHG5_9FLAO|nr:DUF3857 domain-containing protein [Faecalibacter macacae]RLZ12272.1 DUF3857 domain-containing protein [Faecalibacter macacae]